MLLCYSLFLCMNIFSVIMNLTEMVGQTKKAYYLDLNSLYIMSPKFTEFVLYVLYASPYELAVHLKNYDLHKILLTAHLLQ